MNKLNYFFKTYIKSPDFILALLLALILYLTLPVYIDANFTSSIYNIGITVLSIIFSLFFAALAIIMSSTDNDFILYLEEEKHFTSLISTFKVVLVFLFLSLILSIVLFAINDYYIKTNVNNPQQHKFCLISFLSIFTYSLIATALSILDTINFTSFRTRFLSLKNNNEEKNPQ